ncbi:hypothetical protein G2W53_015607 [Senna tora]|uniref:Uncharacterized protein n=1 Tax=Senna tora TaxID=362788 RepID=A0A834WVM0_9FABA|nr:hypothetical protein G2W53_015607 [Senna tora]
MIEKKKHRLVIATRVPDGESIAFRSWMSEAGQENVLFEIEIQSLQPNEEGGSEEHSSGSEGDDGESNSESSDEEDNDLCYRYIDPILEQGVNENNSTILQYEGDDKYHSEEIHSSIESEDEENEGKKKKKRIKWTQFNERVQYGNVSFELGMESKNLAVFKQAVRDYTVNKGVQFYDVLLQHVSGLLLVLTANSPSRIQNSF